MCQISKEKISRAREWLEQRAGEDDFGDGEIDDEAGDVDECSNERSGSAGGIEAAFAKNEGENSAGKSAKSDHAEQAERDGESDQEIVFAVGVPEGLPNQDADQANYTENSAEHNTSGNFAADDPPPVF